MTRFLQFLRRQLAAKIVFTLAIGVSSATALANGELDTFSNQAWSPDSTWLAFNPIDRSELFFTSFKAPLHLLLRPMGDISLDLHGIVSPNAPTAEVLRRTGKDARTVPSPGRSKLSLLEWSRDSKAVAYQIDRNTRGIFSVSDASVTQRLSKADALPWWKHDDLRITFELVGATKDRAPGYWIRAVRPDGTVVKQVAFENSREIRQLTVLRFRNVSFLSPNNRFLLYPRFGEKGWQLILDPIQGDSVPRALTDPSSTPPYEWKLTNDARYLAVAESEYTLKVGDIDDWANAQKVPLANLAVTISWSVDGRFLACNDKQLLFLLTRAGDKDGALGDLLMVTDSCSPRFWGWRGTRLYFGDARTDPTNLFYVDAERPGLRPIQIVKARDWQSAPREISVSPDGSRMVCLVIEFDSEGRALPQLWQIALQPGAQWELVYSFKP
jgi:hypothetical protein